MKELALIFSAILSTIFSGYVFSTIWGWFMVDKFSLPSLSIIEALGVLLVVKYMTLQVNLTNTEVEDSDIKTATFSWLIPLIALFVGWIYTLFM